MSRSLPTAIVTAVAAMTPATAWAQDGPTLTFDRPCYSPGDTMRFSGTGYTPGGAIEMLFNSLSTQSAGQWEITADPIGAIAGTLDTPDPDLFLDDSAFSGMMGVATNDARATFTLSRFEVQTAQPNGRAPKSRKPMRVTAVGFTNANGQTLYVHYTRNRTRLKTIKLGRLGGDCGDRIRTLPRALPRGLRPGRYKLIFNTSARNTGRAPWYSNQLRLR